MAGGSSVELWLSAAVFAYAAPGPPRLSERAVRWVGTQPALHVASAGRADGLSLSSPSGGGAADDGRPVGARIGAGLERAVRMDADVLRVSDGLVERLEHLQWRPGRAQGGQARSGNATLGVERALVLDPARGGHGGREPAFTGTSGAAPCAPGRSVTATSPSRRQRIWAWICGCASPPIVPATIARRPLRRTMTGMSVCSGRLPPAIRFGDVGVEAEAGAAVVRDDAGRRLEDRGAEAVVDALDDRHGPAVRVGGDAGDGVAGGGVGRRAGRAGHAACRGLGCPGGRA